MTLFQTTNSHDVIRNHTIRTLTHQKVAKKGYWLDMIELPSC